MLRFFCFLLLLTFIDITAKESSSKRGSLYNDSIYYNPLFVNDPDIADVTVFYSDDGFYYMFGTGFFYKQYLYKSKNLVNWECTYINPIPGFVQQQIKVMKQPENVQNPKYKASDQMWAPQIVKVGSKYNLYTSIAAYGGIICLQSDDPIGPYIFPHSDTMGNPLKLIDLDDVGMEFDVIDPCFVRDFQDGSNYLFFGSSFGIYRIKLSKDGTKVENGAKFVHVAGSRDRGKHGIDYEGTMLYWHGGYWYMILSPRRDYRLLCWRSRTLTGEFVDKDGKTPMSDNYGWEILRPQIADYRTPEGYHFVSTGHSGEIVTDKNGRCFIFCHAGVSEPNKKTHYRLRAVCMTEIKWTEDGWPVAVTKDKKVSYENRRPDM